jgi:hypothetical protein
MLVSQFEPLGKTSREIGAVRDDDQNRVCLPVNVEQHAGEDVSRFLIEVAGRFVAQQQSRLHDESARECDTLLLAPGELRRAMGKPFL